MDIKLARLNQITLECLGEVDQLKIIEKFTKAGIEILSADFGLMFWRLADDNSYKLVYKSPETPYEPKLPRRYGYNYKASKGRIPYFVSKPMKSLLPYMKSLAIIPIFYKNHQYGNIVLCFKKERSFTLEERPISMALSNTAAQVITINTFHKKTEKNAQRLLKQKDEFFNIASHELKTPVAAIKGFVQILNQKTKGANAETSYFLSKINLHTEKLARLVNDLLDVSRIETGKLKFKRMTFELYNLLEEVIEGVNITLPHHSISFKSNHRFWISGDSEHIERVIINLLTNAAKYSPVGSKIKVSLEERDGKARVNVEDFGIGIAKKDQQKIFKRFFQSKDSSKTSGLPGLGLGLYIAREILKRHGGELHFESKRQSKGSIFYFLLPYSKHKIIKK